MINTQENYYINGAISGDIFYDQRKLKEIEVISKYPDSLLLSDNLSLTYHDFPFANKRYRLKEKYKAKFQTSDVVLSKLGHKYFVVCPGKNMVLQGFGDNYFLYDCKESNYKAMD
jgi:hypothetical protein